MKHFILGCVLTFAPLAAQADNIGGTSYSGPPLLNCMDPGCAAECQNVASGIGNSPSARRCATACATENHVASGSSPGAYMAQCMAGATKSEACATELAGLAPTGGAPGRLDLVKALYTLFASGGACSTM